MVVAFVLGDDLGAPQGVSPPRAGRRHVARLAEACSISTRARRGSRCPRPRRRCRRWSPLPLAGPQPPGDELGTAHRGRRQVVEDVQEVTAVRRRRYAGRSGSSPRGRAVVDGARSRGCPIPGQVAARWPGDAAPHRLADSPGPHPRSTTAPTAGPPRRLAHRLRSTPELGRWTHSRYREADRVVPRGHPAGRRHVNRRHLRPSVRGDSAARPVADAVRHEWLAAVRA